MFFPCKKRHTALTRPSLARERVTNLSKNMLWEVCPGRVQVAILDTLLAKAKVKPSVGEGKQWEVALQASTRPKAGRCLQREKTK